MKENALIKLLKKLRSIKPFKGIPRGNSNEIWKKVLLKQAEDYYKRGLYSKAEYKQKIKEINNKKLCSGSSKENQK